MGFTFSVVARPPVQQPATCELSALELRDLEHPQTSVHGLPKAVGPGSGKDVTIIQLGGLPEAFAALKGGSVQAAVLPPPFSTEAMRQGMVQLMISTRVILSSSV